MTADTTNAEPANRDRSRAVKRNKPFDVALGARLRSLRVAAGMSQTAFGQAIGISFQQVQKYELGRDRVAASTLKAMADALAVHPGDFFDDDMPVPTGSGSDRKAVVKARAMSQQICEA